MLFRFGSFQLDGDRRVLTKSGAVVDLEPMVLSLLGYLVENRGRVVSRDELVRDVWEGRFVSDSAVSQAVYAARRALEDDARSPRFLRTVHGHGFEFVADVELGPPEPLPAGPSPRPRRLGRLATVGLGALAVAALFGWVARRGPGGESAEVAASVERPPIRLLILRVAAREPDPELQLLGLGVTDYLLRDLARVAGLDPISADAAEAQLGEVDSLEALARKVHVEHLLEGSIFRSDTERTARLELRLHSLVGERLESLPIGPFELPFLAEPADLDRFEQLRRAIAAEVVAIISPALALPGDLEPSVRDPEAYRLVMAAYEKMTENFCDGGRAARLLERALNVEPDYGMAYGLLAISQYNRVWACGEPGELLEEAVRNLDLARRAGSRYGPDFESMIGSILVETGRVEEAWSLASSGTATYPTSAAVRYLEIYVLRYAGLLAEAEARLDRALEMDPFFFVHGPGGEAPNVLLYSGRLTEYLETLPESGTAYHGFYRGFAEYLRGDIERARGALDPAFRRQPGNLFGKLAQAMLAILDGDRAGAVAIVGQIEQQRAVHGLVDGEVTYKQAQLFALAGEPDRALENFRLAVEQGFICTPYFLRDPAMTDLRGLEGFWETFARAEEQRQALSASFGIAAEPVGRSAGKPGTSGS